MKIRLGELRKIIREAAGIGEGLAAYVAKESDGDSVTVYYPAPVERLMSSTGVDGAMSEMKKWPLRYIVGRVKVVDPGAPCWGAWVIDHIVGPGRLMYGIAYALSPTGLLISDRSSMTPAAIDAWRGMAARGNRGRKKLDDIIPPHETPPVEDDCELRDEEFLNYAYESQGWEAGELASMRAEHEQVVARIMKSGTLSRAEVEKILTDVSVAHFQRQQMDALRA